MAVSDYATALDFLLGRLNYERTAPPRRGWKLQRMRALLKILGDPQSGRRIIHIAGTKGKGSTSAAIASILTAAGFRTGLYTSPHLERLEERIQIDRRPCPPETLASLTAEAERAAREMDRSSDGPTFFELTTALALLHFRRQEAEWIVLETGLGGRLDSTNVCDSMLSVITSISFDHTRQLGRTLERIAREKAGIIKAGRPVVSGVQTPAARDVIRGVAAQHGCLMREWSRDFTGGDVSLSWGESGGPVGTEFTYRDLQDRQAPWSESRWSIPLLGRHQALNACLAVATIDQLRRLDDDARGVSAEHIRQGLAQMLIPARIEVMQRNPLVILDVAHNQASAAALGEVLDHWVSRQVAPPRRQLVFGSSSDKDIEGMLRELLPRFDKVWLTQFRENPRAAPLEGLLRSVKRLAPSLDVTCQEHPRVAWEQARQELAENDLLCIAGSLFLAAELRPILREPFAVRP